MKKPTLSAMYLGDLAHVAQATIHQLELWISHKDFRPSNPTVRGSSRRYGANDAYRAAIMAYMVRQCGLPVGIGRHVSEMLSEQPALLVEMLDNEVIALVFCDQVKAAAATRLRDQSVVDAITFAVGWFGPGSVAWTLNERKPMGVTLVNLSHIVREARARLVTHLDGLGRDGYDDVEE
jgi:hypothetical protein